MKRLTAKEIKKIVLGITLSDGYIDTKGDRFELYSKQFEYAEYVAQVLKQISGMGVRFTIRRDKRGWVGYRVATTKHAYWSNLKKTTYGVRKQLINYSAERVDEEALAHIWMCDGYLEHAKNRKKDTVQNIGWFCLEAFPKEELVFLQRRLLSCWGIETSLVKKPWGFGYRIRVGGEHLRKLISIMYPFILNCFSYKTPLFYKQKGIVDMSLPNAEHFIREYSGVEDIVRHSKQLEQPIWNNHCLPTELAS